jgi:ribosomal-protein-alanine acetyltransferase
MSAPGICLRRAFPASDPEEVMRIENACFPADAFSRRQIVYLMARARGLFLMAEYDGVRAGYLSLIVSRRHHTGRIYSLAVAPAHRGMGIADALMDGAIAYAKEKGLRAVFLEVRTENRAAIRLYEKKGFALRFTRYGYYEDGASACCMVLRLSL